MRLWSIHPCYLDSKGLVALWREGLLAQSVLIGNTKGYINHPQLSRFNKTNNPTGAIASYLRGVINEADARGYKFNRTKIINKSLRSQIPVSSGQIFYEFQHLLKKVKGRDQVTFDRLQSEEKIKLHPLFTEVHGGIEKWEKV